MNNEGSPQPSSTVPMTLDQIFIYLSDRIRDVQMHGFLITGDLNIVKPKFKGIIDLEVNGVKQSEELGHLNIKTVRRMPKPEPFILADANRVVDSATAIIAAYGDVKIQTDAATCPECGNIMQRTGTCYTCGACGWNGGCG